MSKGKQSQPLRAFQEVFPFIADAGESSPVIVGGQAVELLGEKFALNNPGLQDLLPCLTEDLDLLGSRSLVEKIGKEIGCQTYVTDPFSKADSTLSGTVYLQKGHAHVLFALRNSKIKSHDIRASAIIINYEGKFFRVIHPLLLLMEKAYLSFSVDQQNRNDVAHLKILILCMQEYLSEKIRDAKDDTRKGRDCVNLLGSVLDFLKSKIAAKAKEVHRIKWDDILPFKAINRSFNPKLISFRKNQLERFKPE